MPLSRRASKNVLALVFTGLSALGSGCGGVPAQEEDGLSAQAQGLARSVPERVDGTLVAQARLSTTHLVEFWRFSDGAIHMREVGSARELEKQVDFEALAALSPIERFERLAGPGEPVPQALSEAVAQSQREQGAHPVGPTPWAPPPAEEQRRETVSGSSGFNQLIDWTADAQWFQQNFCTWSSVDSVWCPTNVGWADAGDVYAMYYESTCLAESQDQSARYTTKYWNGSAWINSSVSTVAPRTWSKWIFEQSRHYSARCESIASGGDSRVAFGHRFRWATPSVGGLSDFPSDRTYSGGLSNDTQGVTHDSSYWFMTNTYNVWRWPVGSSINENPSYVSGNPWSGLYNHLGDLSYGANYLFLPLEKNGGSGSWCAFGVLNRDLQYYNYAIVPDAGVSDQGDSCPWVAYNPRDGYLYSSAFNTSYINKYSWSLAVVNGTWQLTLGFVARIPLKDGNGNPMSLSSLQGGEFSNTNKLYLVSDSASGVYAVDIFNGRVQTWFGVQVDHSSTAAEELEGITLWDVDNGMAPGVSGQIHVQMCDNDLSNSDDFYFKHYRASEPSKL